MNPAATAVMVILTVAGCSLRPISPPLGPGFERLVESRGDLVTLGWRRPGAARSGRPLLVVIEGDGAAWSRFNTPPEDPTPRSGMGARLASAFARDAPVLYLARPGQYLAMAEAERLSGRHWTVDRFAEPSVSALNALIERALVPGQQVLLVGYSGGGVLAAELALRRDDVAGLVTVAAPLDLAAWTALHRVTPLSATRPTDELLAGLSRARFAQRHLYGSEDRVVPPDLVAALAKRLPAGTVRLFEGLDHDGNWEPVVASVLGSLAVGLPTVNTLH